MLRATIFSGVLAAFCCWLSATSPAVDADSAPSLEGAAAITDLNTQRGANGIAPVTLNQSLVWWCPNEDDPTFIPGEWAREDSGYTDWGAESSPWDAAQIHQFGMYNPAFSEAGDANISGVACMGLGGTVPSTPEPVFHSFTGDLGPTSVPPLTYTEGEGPFQTQQIVGIPQGQVTGPQLILYATGPWPSQPPGLTLQAVSWSLTNEAGEAVPNVRMVDENASIAYTGFHGYFFDGGVMVPPVLTSNAHYVATVHWRYGTSEAIQVVPFTTDEGSPIVVLSQRARSFPLNLTAGAMLEATYHARGYPMMECYFEYGPTSSYGARAPCANVSTSLGNGSMIALLSGLTPDSVYHFQLHARSAGRAVQAWDETFVAPAASPPAPSFSSEAARHVVGNPSIVQLTSELLATWRTVRITTLLHTGHDRVAILAPSAGAISVVWEAQKKIGKRHRHAVWNVVGRGYAAPSSAGPTHIVISLTREGRSLLARVRHMKIRARIRLVSKAGRVSKTATFMLTR